MREGSDVNALVVCDVDPDGTARYARARRRRRVLAVCATFGAVVMAVLTMATLNPGTPAFELLHGLLVRITGPATDHASLPGRQARRGHLPLFAQHLDLLQVDVDRHVPRGDGTHHPHGLLLDPALGLRAHYLGDAHVGLPFEIVEEVRVATEPFHRIVETGAVGHLDRTSDFRDRDLAQLFDPLLETIPKLAQTPRAQLVIR